MSSPLRSVQRARLCAGIELLHGQEADRVRHRVRRHVLAVAELEGGLAVAEQVVGERRVAAPVSASTSSRECASQLTAAHVAAGLKRPATFWVVGHRLLQVLVADAGVDRQAIDGPLILDVEAEVGVELRLDVERRQVDRDAGRRAVGVVLHQVAVGVATGAACAPRPLDAGLELCEPVMYETLELHAYESGILNLFGEARRVAEPTRGVEARHHRVPPRRAARPFDVRLVEVGVVQDVDADARFNQQLVRQRRRPLGGGDVIEPRLAVLRGLRVARHRRRHGEAGEVFVSDVLVVPLVGGRELVAVGVACQVRRPT